MAARLLSATTVSTETVAGGASVLASRPCALKLAPAEEAQLPEIE
jgi:hypothetical protein